MHGTLAEGRGAAPAPHLCSPAFRTSSFEAAEDLAGAAWRDGLGLMLFAAGLGFAIWPPLRPHRAQLRHPDDPQGTPAAGDECPYRLVRHAIHTGPLPAPVGTAVALGWTWLIATALARIYFGYAATTEERFLGPAVPRYVSGLSALHQDAPAVHLPKASHVGRGQSTTPISLEPLRVLGDVAAPGLSGDANDRAKDVGQPGDTVLHDRSVSW
jgi:hypothetical protein